MLGNNPERCNLNECWHFGGIIKEILPLFNSVWCAMKYGNPNNQVVMSSVQILYFPPYHASPNKASPLFWEAEQRSGRQCSIESAR